MAWNWPSDVHAIVVTDGSRILVRMRALVALITCTRIQSNYWLLHCT